MNPIIPIDTYTLLIKNGDKTIEQAPTRLRVEVQTYLDAGKAKQQVH